MAGPSHRQPPQEDVFWAVDDDHAAHGSTGTAPRHEAGVSSECSGSCNPGRMTAAAVTAAEPPAVTGTACATRGAPTGGPEARLMLDTGATNTFLTSTMAGAAGFQEGGSSERVHVHDAQGNVIEARGGGALLGHMEDSDGVWRKEVLSDMTYTSDSFALDLLSFDDYDARGWRLRLGGGDHHLLSPGGIKYPVLKEDGHYYLVVRKLSSTAPAASELLAAPVTSTREAVPSACADDAGDVSEARAPTPQLNPNGRLARQPLFPVGSVPPVGSSTPGDFGRPACGSRACADSLCAGPMFSGKDLSGALHPQHEVNTETSETPAEVTERGAAQAADAAAERAVTEAAATEALKTRHSNWVYYHNAFNHRSEVVEAMRKQGLLQDVAMPPNFRCEACELAKARNGHFGSEREIPRDPKSMRPWAETECDIYGPIDCGDRNGFRYILAFVCVSTGSVFVQPMRQKSDSVEVLKQFAKWVASIARFIEKKHNYPPGTSVIHLLRSDRDGSFTTTWGATRSEFDTVAAEVVGFRYFATPGQPRSGTPHVERFWGSMKDAADAMMVASQKGDEFKFDAMLFASWVHNRVPTSSNLLGNGEPPFKTLGVEASIEGIVPFDTPCVVKLVPAAKGDIANRCGRVIGFGVDTPGLRVHLDPGANATAKDAVEIITTVNATPRRNGQPWRMDALGQPGRVDTMPAARSVPYVPLPTYAEARARDTVGDVTSVIPVTQQVGSAPGDAGSRQALQSIPPPATPRSPAQPLMSPMDAVNKITNAMNKGWSLAYVQVNPKSGDSADRYEIYKAATSFSDLTGFGKRSFPNRKKVLKGGLKAKSGDVVHDVRHGYLAFLDTAPELIPGATGAGANAATIPPHPATPPPTTPPGAPYDAHLHYVSAAAPPPRDGVQTANQVGDEAVIGREQSLPAWAARQRRRRFLASAAVRQESLSEDDRAALRAGLLGQSTYMACPDVIMRAAVAQTTQAALPAPQRAPKTLSEAMASPDRDRWIEALKKEIGGLRERDVWEEVMRTELPAGVTVAPSQLCFDIKKDGTHKVRFVVRGDLTEKGTHFLETKSSMATLEAVRMLVSFAAGSNTSLRSLDFTQAFVNAPEPNNDMYIALPQLPPELIDAGYGSAKGPQRVGHLKKNLYGLKQAGRTWSQFLMRWMIENLGARCYMSDRNAFTWSWTNASGVEEQMRGVIHVDDMLYTGSSPAVLDEFFRRIAAAFAITGGEEATDFCGLQLCRDWTKRTITLHQRDFAIMMAKKYDFESFTKTEVAPYLMGPPSKLVPFEGDTSEVEQFDYAMFIGDLTWYSRTNPSLAWRAHDLARFMQNPGPEHVKAAKHVLRYIYGHLDAGITYHGNDIVLSQSYDHLNKLIMAYDADFDHAGTKACSGVTVLMNGAAVAWRVRRQSTVSQTTAEAEVKACSVGTELALAMADLHGEFMGTTHGSIRAMGDSEGAMAQIGHGLDNKASSSYKRCQAYCEDAMSQGFMWWDHVPGPVNPADIFTKAVGNITEYQNKAGVVSGSAPHLYHSTKIIKILADAVRTGNVQRG